MLVNVPKSFFVRIVKATQILLKLSIFANFTWNIENKRYCMDFLYKSKSCVTWVCNSVCNADWLETFRYNCTRGQINNEGGVELHEIKRSWDKTKIDKEIIWWKINKYLLNSLAHEIVLRRCVYIEICFSNKCKYRILSGGCY